ncbi:MAG: CPBP family intramembrane metalloprotease [Actinomycetota bacterium]|nr:CPBP family intramembrane metalloprotease [Actinomycetota bacterium]
MRTAVQAPVLLLVGFGSAVAVRVGVGGPGVAQSRSAGLAFAACLLALTAVSRTRIRLTRYALGIGVAGAVLLCVPVLLSRLGRPLHPAGGFAAWAAVVAVVAVAEELFLRGALFDAVNAAAGELSAIVVGAVAFTLLHVPLYGWHVIPLDLAVGIVLGELRRRSGTAAAPAVAHTLADFAAWFLR